MRYLIIFLIILSSCSKEESTPICKVFINGDLSTKRCWSSEKDCLSSFKGCSEEIQNYIIFSNVLKIDTLDACLLFCEICQ